MDAQLCTELVLAGVCWVCFSCWTSSHTCDRSDSVLVGFSVDCLGVVVAINCFASRRTVAASVTRQRSSDSSRLFVRLEADNIWLILSIKEGLGCSWGVELGRESRRVSVALGATCDIARNIVF